MTELVLLVSCFQELYTLIRPEGTSTSQKNLNLSVWSVWAYECNLYISGYVWRGDSTIFLFVIAKSLSMKSQCSSKLLEKEILNPSIKGRKEDPGNYCPVSLISVPGRSWNSSF